MYCPDDTVAAVSSPAGLAGRGVIRISGSDALVIGRELVKGGRVRLGEGFSCGGVCYEFIGPRSYTGEDTVELHLPGSPVLLQMVMGQIVEAGARLAEAGEFTARAFFNGRMDLTEAEAVAEVISARSDAELAAAERLLAGALHERCGKLAGRLAEILGLVEAGIDFSEEEIEFASAEELLSYVQEVREALRRLLEESLSWEDLHELPRVVFAGAANAGKSSLVNALLGLERSIVSSMAGTTRDVLTAPLRLAEGECLLVDTAGLGVVDDVLAAETQEVTKSEAAGADLLVWVMDGSKERAAEVPAGALAVVNKSDILLKLRVEGAIVVSALTGQGVDRLKAEIGRRLGLRGGEVGGSAVALNLRQRKALEAGLEHLGGAVERLARGRADEILAVELRSALDELGTVSGAIVSDEVLGEIFGRFCVGK